MPKDPQNRAAYMRGYMREWRKTNKISMKARDQKRGEEAMRERIVRMFTRPHMADMQINGRAAAAFVRELL
jgi:hypothetical protein